MLDIRDLRAFDGPNFYALEPLVVVRYAGDIEAGEQLIAAVADYALALALPCEVTHQTEVTALGERVILWRTPYRSALEALIAALTEQPEAPEHSELAGIVAAARDTEQAAVMELVAAARARGLPVLQHDDGWAQLGHGSQGWRIEEGAEPPWERIGAIPIIAVTGTNGKTTTTRLIDHTLRTAGWATGRTDTDGVWVGGQLLDNGDWTGYGGAQMILSNPRVAVAVLESARGGILRRGLAFERCDIAVITNISEDHLPDRGIATTSEMARAKGTVARIVASEGAVVLNADDALLRTEVAPLVQAPIIWFSLEASNPVVGAHCGRGGRALVLDQNELVLLEGESSHVLMAVEQLPLAFGGLARHNIANALAAAAALVAFGLSAGQIVFGLASFKADQDDNPGRLNVFSAHGITVIVDYAHNSDGLRMLLETAAPFVGTKGRLWAVYSGTGDRTDAQIRDQGRILGGAVDRLVIKEDPAFWRGREAGEIEPLLWEGALEAGMPENAIIQVDSDEEAFELTLTEAQPEDVVVFMVYRDRLEQLERLRRWSQGDALV